MYNVNLVLNNIVGFEETVLFECFVKISAEYFILILCLNHIHLNCVHFMHLKYTHFIYALNV